MVVRQKKKPAELRLFGVRLRSKWTVAVAILAVTAAVYLTVQQQEDASSRSGAGDGGANKPRKLRTQKALRAHSKKFERRIEKVMDGVHVAIGYTLANMIILEGTDGIVIVDTTESDESASEILREYRKTVSDKPLKAIIFTHFHLDHIQGARGILDDHKGEDVKVYAHSTMEFESTRFSHLGGSAFGRSFRQFGVFLKRKSENVNSGIGPFLNVKPYPNHVASFATDTFQHNLTLTIAGLDVELYHTPGETDDHVTVWLPRTRLLLPGDNIYEAFPNLYAIRGSPTRNAHTWYSSLDFVRSLGATVMVPSHTRPLKGADAISEALTSYRDAIQFVHDQTVRWMNQGMEIDDVVPRVRLPETLAGHPFLQEFYGTVEWSVRGIYDSYVGWFDADPANLFPLAKDERARRWSELLMTSRGDDVGTGTQVMMAGARESLAKADAHLVARKEHMREEIQWAVEVATMARRACGKCREGDELLVDALTAAAGAATNANARNYYLTCAREISPGLKLIVTKADLRRLAGDLHIDVLMSMLPYKLKAEGMTGRERLSVAVTFTDLVPPKSHLYRVRNAVIEYSTPEEVRGTLDAHVRTTTAVWLAVIREEKSGLRAYASGEIKVDGSVMSFRKLTSLLDM